MSESMRGGGAGAGSGTVRCPECGAKNEADDDFCGQCGAYLAWEATDAAASAAPVAVAAADSAPVAVAAAAPVSAVQASEAGPAEPAAAFEAAPDVAPVAESDAAAVAEPDAAGIAESDAAGIAEPDAEPAREAVVEPDAEPEPDLEPSEPLTDPALSLDPPQVAGPVAMKPVAAGPVAMKPVAVAPRPKSRPVPMAERPKPGDLVCPQCGTGNTPGRHFCRRCAAPLGATANRRPVSSAQPAAGARPVVRTRRFRPSWVVIPTVVAVLAAIAWLGRGPIGDFTQTALDRVVTSTARNPTGLTASTAAAGRGPELAHDGFANLSWAPGAPGPAVGEFLEASFAEPFRLVALQISPGASTDQAEFLAQARPGDIRVSAMTSTGAVVERTVTLADEPGVQRIDLGIDDVVAVRLTIESANGATDATHVAIAEVEFLGR